MSNKNIAGVVYSSEYGKMCPDCSKPIAGCVCRLARKKTAGDGIVRVRRETKGRKGKCMTVITGIPIDHDALKKLGKELKKKCGSGGSVKSGAIEIQGDHRDSLILELKSLGWTVKRSGG